jgi:hypothetical protein
MIFTLSSGRGPRKGRTLHEYDTGYVAEQEDQEAEPELKRCGDGGSAIGIARSRVDKTYDDRATAMEQKTQGSAILRQQIDGFHFRNFRRSGDKIIKIIYS